MVFPNLVLPLKQLQPMPCSLTPQSPVEGWTEAQKAKIRGCDKNNLLEAATREENKQ